MTSLINKSADWTPIYHKILIFFPTKSLKSLYAARIDELADSNEPAINDDIVIGNEVSSLNWIGRVFLCDSMLSSLYVRVLYLINEKQTQSAAINKREVNQ